MARAPETARTPTLEQICDLLAEAAGPVATLLENNGYLLKGWETRMGEFGPSATLVYICGEAKRKARIGLAWTLGTPTANLSLVRIPRESVWDFLDLSLFAEETTPELDQNVLLIDPDKPLRAELKRVFNLYAELLQGPAAAILRGDAWEEGHYTDWTL